MKHPLIAASALSWAAMLLVLLCRGAGKLSPDHVAWQRLRRLGGEPARAA